MGGEVVATDDERGAKGGSWREWLRKLHRASIEQVLEAEEMARSLHSTADDLTTRRQQVAAEQSALLDEIEMTKSPLATLSAHLADRCRAACERLTALEASQRELERRADGFASLLRGSVARVHLNVGGSLYDTTLGTLCSQPSLLADLLGRPDADLPRDSAGRIFLDRDGSIFRLVLSWLRTGVLPAQRNELLQRELLAEARWLQMDSLVSALEAELGTLEPRGLLLKRLSRQAVIDTTHGDFERLVALIFEQVNQAAERGKRQCTLGFTQQKTVHGRVFTSEGDVSWDATISDESLHRLLSSAQMQRLLLSTLTEDNLEAELKSLSKNVSLGEGMEQWVSTTSHQARGS